MQTLRRRRGSSREDRIAFRTLGPKVLLGAGVFGNVHVHLGAPAAHAGVEVFKLAGAPHGLRRRHAGVLHLIELTRVGDVDTRRERVEGAVECLEGGRVVLQTLQQSHVRVIARSRAGVGVGLRFHTVAEFTLLYSLSHPNDTNGSICCVALSTSAQPARLIIEKGPGHVDVKAHHPLQVRRWPESVLAQRPHRRLLERARETQA